MKGNHKELYRQLRALPWPRLWGEEAARFDRATARERIEGVAVIRAVGAVFPESGPPEQREEVLQWLRKLLDDPEEKVRRYALAALPKIGAGTGEEAALLEMLRRGTGEREAKFLGKTLDKIGGEATLRALEEGHGLTLQTEQKVRASVARRNGPGTILLHQSLAGFGKVRIHLRGRKGLEELVRQEVEEQGRFRVVAVDPGLVAVEANEPFTLADIFALRCFGTPGFVLGRVNPSAKTNYPESLAALIASPLSRNLLETLTSGPIRYRLEFAGKGHQRGAVHSVTNRAYALCPEILNDPRQATWAVEVHRSGHFESVELRPRLSPDPRLAYRLGDVPAASHPPLAACMVRLAGRGEEECVWDPFCGSGLELIERARLGGVRRLFGTDLSPEAVEIARKNFAAASLGPADAQFTCCDFREFAKLKNLPPRSLTLIITNPPLGRRVPVPNLRGLFDDLFGIATTLLAPGGRLVLTNPFPEQNPRPGLNCEFRQVVDLGGLTCRLELYRRR